MGLNPRQQLFVQEYVKDFKGAEAARRAGYSESTAKEQASRLLTKDHIQAEVNRLRTKLTDELEMDAKWVLERIRRVVDEAMDSDPMNGMVALKGLELVGKHNAMFQESVGVGIGLAIHLHLGGS